MSKSPDPESAENPFSASYVRPGSIPYQFPAGKSAQALVERLWQNDGQGQIVGPHGSGKSALVATLVAALEQSGRPTLLIELHDGQSRLPVSLRRLAALAPGTVVIVDGYEQLAWWRRFGLRRFCRRRGLGLVVTSHVSLGLPDLFRTTTSLALARHVVELLLGEEQSLIAVDELNRRFTLRQGDMREVLFDLYDVYEARRHGGNASTHPAQG